MTRMDHVNITVKNLDEAIDWYRDLFGFQKVEEGTTESGSRWAIIAVNDSMIAMTENRQKVSASQMADQHYHRIYHFGIRIDDRNEWVEKVNSKKLNLNYGGEIKNPHSISWYIFDPSGHEIEVSWCGGKPLQFPMS